MPELRLERSRLVRGHPGRDFRNPSSTDQPFHWRPRELDERLPVPERRHEPTRLPRRRGGLADPARCHNRRNLSRCQLDPDGFERRRVGVVVGMLGLPALQVRTSHGDGPAPPRAFWECGIHRGPVLAIGPHAHPAIGQPTTAHRATPVLQSWQMAVTGSRGRYTAPSSGTPSTLEAVPDALRRRHARTKRYPTIETPAITNTMATGPG